MASRWCRAGIVTALLAAGCGGAPAKPAQSPAQGNPVEVAPPKPAAEPGAPTAEPATDTGGPATANTTSPSAGGAPGAPSAIPNTAIRFLGGDGSSVAQAIVIHGATGEADGVAAEYWYVTALLGKRGTDWQLGTQALLEHGGHQYDLLDIKAQNGPHQFYFDITEYFGKF